MNTTPAPKPARWLRYWLATRPAFLSVSAVGCLVGFGFASSQGGSTPLWAAALAILIAVAAQASANVINDYYDAQSGADATNQSRIAPFTGGGRTIQEGYLSSEQVRWLAYAIMAAAAAAGLLLLITLDAWRIAWIGLLGLATGWAYSAHPFKLMSRGLWGEIAIALAWGLIVMGCALLTLPEVSLALVICAGAYGLMVTNILFVNQIPDIESDQAVQKITLAVNTTAGQHWRWYAVFFTLAHVGLAALVVSQQLAPSVLLAWIALPFSIMAARAIYKANPVRVGEANSADRAYITSAIKQTIVAAHLFGLGAAIGLV